MMASAAFLFALLAGVSMATYTVFLRLASPGIHPALGATIITGVALLVNASLTLTMKATGAPIPFTSKSVYLVVVVGVAAACADLFTLSAYARGLKITSSFMIGGTSTVLVLLIGFVLLKEPFTWLKLLAIGLIVTGIFLLQREGL
jgi:drug/metabolite transporter (DMT)-like permease